MNVKRITALLLALIMIFTAAGCSSKESAGSSKDSVVIAIGSEPETLDPTKGWGHGNSPIVQSTLVSYTADLTRCV